MIIKFCVFCVIFNILFNFCAFIKGEYLTAKRGQTILENVVNLTQSLLEITPYINLTLAEIPPNCIQIQCKFVCFNGKSAEIEEDILRVSGQNNHFCNEIEELRLYNYVFYNQTLSYGFLGNFSDKVESLYVTSANIKEITAGAFAKGKFKEIYIENLQLQELKKDFFLGISAKFKSLSIIQKEMPVQSVHSEFLSYVQHQIKYLTLQAGLKSVSNLTGGNFLLNNLIYVDFSNNNFGNEMESFAFNKLSMIEHIDLSHSNLEYLPSYLFAKFTTSLEYLDLSYNKLRTISLTVFGWKKIPRDLRIYAEGNAWFCTCNLHHEMKKIFINNKARLFCSEPEYYKGWAVLDPKLCAENLKPPKVTTTTVNYSNYESDSNSLLPQYLIKLNCSAKQLNKSKHFTHLIQWPSIVFNVTAQQNQQVQVVVDSPKKSYDSLGLLWFSKVATNYYKMEINYNEYGLGCLNNISHVTNIDNLSPNRAYTFCVVLKQRWTVSPFSCKSIYVSDDVTIKKSAWLTLDMRMAGWLLIFFGIIMFLFTGVLMIYLMLKHKPILLKGSRRVTTTNSNRDDILVLPKKNSVRAIKEKENNLARHNPLTNSQKHRQSTDSEASYQSYINTNTNLYEAIPYKKQHPSNENYITSKSLEGDSYAAIMNSRQELENFYLMPLEMLPNAEDLLRYAKIFYCDKSNSNYAFPEVPTDKPLPIENLGKIYMLDNEV